MGEHLVWITTALNILGFFMFLGLRRKMERAQDKAISMIEKYDKAYKELMIAYPEHFKRGVE